MKISNAIQHRLEVFTILWILLGCISCIDVSEEKATEVDTEAKSFAAYNHAAFVVKNLDSSVAFYHYLFDFDTIHYPFPYRENIRAKWMSIGNGGELHLGEFKGDTNQYSYPGHIGFTVTSIDTILSRLKALNIELPDMESMPNGERSIHIADIDGNNIHIIERKD